MPTEIIVALIGLVGSLGGAFLGILVETKFKGFCVGNMSFNSYTNQCSGCSNNCEIITIVEGEVTELQHDVRDLKAEVHISEH